jgi:hypothetical protein
VAPEFRQTFLSRRKQRKKGLGAAGIPANIFVKEKTRKVKRVRWRRNFGGHFCQGENNKGKKV